MTERSTITEDRLKWPSRTTTPLQTRCHPCTRDFLGLENGASYELWKSRSIVSVKASGDKHFSYEKSSLCNIVDHEDGDRGGQQDCEDGPGTREVTTAGYRVVVGIEIFDISKARFFRPIEKEEEMCLR